MRFSLRHNMSEPIMRLQAFLRATAAPNRDVVRIDPFTAFLHPGDPLKYLNYAIPDDGAEPTRDGIERLRASFRERDRLPRLEWVEEAAPRVASALEEAGMRSELRTPMMEVTRSELVEPDVPGAVVAAVDDEDLREMSNLQRVAFGGQPLGEEETPSRPGGGAVLARMDGEPVSAASWTRVVDAHSEIVGVATADRWRRRGLAGLVTAAAAKAAFEAGASTCVLSPGDETALRVYARAGFRPVATMLHYSDDPVPVAPVSSTSRV
jgi:ribosomal protein S18 acetylase RimI-like enzyme